MKTKHKSLIGIFLFCFFLFTITIYLYQQTKNFEPPPKIEIKGEMPDFAFENKEGKSFNLKDYKGKTVLLSFWASWCAPCLVELPMFQNLYKEYHKNGFQILAINLDDSKEEAFDFVERFWQKENIQFATFYDFDQSSARMLQIGGLPTNFLLDENLNIVFESSGLQDWESAKIKALIENLLRNSKE